VELDALKALLASDGTDLNLAQFQFEATATLLKALGSRHDGGLMVCAGTGSGKTLAFYLPTLARMAALAKPNDHWTQAIAVYPRTELLKDQFTEAYRQARLLDRVLGGAKRRTLLIGAFYGQTPERAAPDTLASTDGWTRRRSGFECPMMRCPSCDGNLLWRDDDLRAARARLKCHEASCGQEITDRQVLLTREQMRAQPPDLLFTTTEMLNRHLTNPRYHRIFGVRQPPERSPYVMLLDEIHSYGGVHGAHVALLLRRWRSLIRRSVQYVGLSATLADPLGFLSDMTGVPASRLALVSPTDDLISDGQEYQLLLRWNPGSATQVMSTTIQAAMLMARLLDDPHEQLSDGVFPPKVFLFTDNLDATNRLYNNLQDAEARDSYGRPVSDREPLAALRARSEPGPAERLGTGQNWRACEDIGHRLSQPAERLEVGRTSSQDSGVAVGAQVIVATSSLELGYNDPTVGAIIQHKAPLGAAAFLQRRGRAGRRRITRPWTVVVLSDFGRDRQAYQAYEELLSPQVGRPALPVANRYVLKMQAVYAFLDWLSLKTGRHAWSVLSHPAGSNQWARPAQLEIRAVVEQLLDSPESRADLVAHLMRALKISEDEVTALMWEPPRALMTSMLPTLHRRLLTDWRRVPTGRDEHDLDPLGGNAPLPDFIPPSLFTDLMVPEVAIHTAVHGEDAPDIHCLTIVQALNTMAPGNVTRRFGFRHALDSHWIAPPDLAAEGVVDLPVTDYCTEYDQIGPFQIITPQKRGQQTMDVACLRPFTLNAVQIPQDVKPTSRAFLDWRSQVFSRFHGRQQGVPPTGPINDLVKDIHFFTHSEHCPVTVRRFAVGSDANLRFNDGRESDMHIRFVDEPGGDPAAIGLEQDVDGIAFGCCITRDFALDILREQGLSACRTPYFQHLVLHDEVVAAQANHFQALLLAEATLGSVLEHAIAHGVGLPEAVDWFASPETGGALGSVVESLVPAAARQGHQPDEERGEGDDDDGGQSAARGAAVALAMLHDTQVRSRLAELAQCLYRAPDDEFVEWTRRRLRETLGGALLQACFQMAKSADAGDLLLDTEPGAMPDDAVVPDGDTERIWITESVVGGTGVVESILGQYAEDPRRFLVLVEAAVAPSDLELVDEQLLLALELAEASETVAASFAEVRDAVGQGALAGAVRSLTSALNQGGCDISPSFLRSLAIRALRPGSSPASDALLLEAVRRWRSEEELLGVEIDQRLVCLLLGKDEAIAQLVSAAVGDLADQGGWEVAEPSTILSALMWPRGASLCLRSLAHYNPFARQVGSDPRLIRDEFTRRRRFVSLEQDDWHDLVVDELREIGSVNLRCHRDRRRELAAAIARLTAEPVELDYLRGYPNLTRIGRDSCGYVASFHLREAML
jgi:hypothetical protein